MAMRSINNTFTQGELDPTLFARTDIDIFSKGARKLRNMISLWTGAVQIAPGTKYIDTIVDRENANAVINNTDEARGFDFLYSDDDDIIYTIIVRKSNANVAFDIYYNNLLQVTVTSSAYTTAQIPHMYFAQAQDRVLILHESVPIRQLKRGASHASWTLSTLAFVHKPTFDYSVIGEATSYSSFTFTLGALSGTGVSLTSSSAVFTANHVGGTFIGEGGVARITAVSSSTAATVNIVDDFVSTTVRGNLASLSEVMWTSGGGSPTGQNRGWPARAVFYLNRLIMGRSKELKNVAAVSEAGVFNDFNDTRVDDLAGFTVSLNGKGEQTIQSMVADDSILFLTSNKIFAQSPLVETPLTASNVYFAPQSHNPSYRIEAVTIDNQILYVSSNQSQVMRLAYQTEQAKYLAFPAGILSNHLFETITSTATWDPENIQTRLFAATQDDGSMLMYSTLIEQGVNAWSLRTTRGDFAQVIGDNRQAHSIVKRQITLGSSTFETFIDNAYLSDNTFKAFYDTSNVFKSPSGSSLVVLSSDNDYIVLGNEVPFTAISIALATNASHDCGLVFQYLDGNGFWDTFTPTDNTGGLTSGGSVTWSFSHVINWKPNTVNEVESKYWIRIQRTTDTIATLPRIARIKVNTGERLYLEKFSFNEYMDSVQNKISDSSGNVTGLNHLAGHQVYAIKDGATRGPYFVNQSGTTTIPLKSVSVKIGIQYTPELIPMPLYTPTQDGDNTYSQKYIQDLFIDYVDSLYLRAGIGEELTDIPNMPLNNYTLGQPVTPQTGVFPINPRGSWEAREEIRVTQSQPGPMTIIGVGYHVEAT